eukprot:COSAG02_NODE_48037_length_336_cov_2.008439_2_plen_42_part_01
MSGLLGAALPVRVLDLVLWQDLSVGGGGLIRCGLAPQGRKGP